jgi:hypothetical protein
MTVLPDTVRLLALVNNPFAGAIAKKTNYIPKSSCRQRVLYLSNMACSSPLFPCDRYRPYNTPREEVLQHQVRITNANTVSGK